MNYLSIQTKLYNRESIDKIKLEAFLIISSKQATSILES